MTDKKMNEWEVIAMIIALFGGISALGSGIFQFSLVKAVFGDVLLGSVPGMIWSLVFGVIVIYFALKSAMD